MKALTLLFLLLGSCSSIDSQISKLALPVNKASAIANAIAMSMAEADLDHDGKVPSSFAELETLVRLIVARI